MCLFAEEKMFLVKITVFENVLLTFKSSMITLPKFLIIYFYFFIVSCKCFLYEFVTIRAFSNKMRENYREIYILFIYAKFNGLYVVIHLKNFEIT